MFEKIGDLPAHPLLVHAPLVFVPILGLLSVALLKPSWRTVLLKPVAIFAVITLITTFFAVESGEKLLEILQVGDAIEEHEEAAEMLFRVVLVLTVLLGAAVILRAKLQGAAQTALIAVIALLGLASIGAAVKTGHEGATQVWKTEFQNALQNSGEATGKDDAMESMTDKEHAAMDDPNEK